MGHLSENTGFCSSGAGLEHRQNDSRQGSQPSTSRDEGKMKFMSLRLEAAEAFAERNNEDLLAACRRAENAESKAHKFDQKERELRVRFHSSRYTVTSSREVV